MEASDSSASDSNGEGAGDVEATMTQRRKWTPEEDERLKSAVQLHGPMNWRQIAKFVGTRNHTQCLQRWRKSLSPGLCKGVWSPEEDAQLVRLFYRGFKNWGEVAEHMVGRTPKQCRERWMHHLDPAINKGEWTKEEDELILQLHQGMGNRWAEIAHGVPGRSSDAIKNRVGRLACMLARSHRLAGLATRYSRKPSTMASSISLETLSHLQGAQLFVGSAIAYVFGVRRMQARREMSTKKPFDTPRSPPKKSAIYTRTGDSGTSQLYSGERRAKDDPTFEALGATDELNAAIGLAIEYSTPKNGLQDYLVTIQSRLLDMGAAIATPVPTSSETKRERTRFDHKHVEDVEQWVDLIDQRLPPLKNFILPSGGLCSAHLHVARTICRRAERTVIPLVQSGQVDPEVGKYLNRLSDFLFVAARWAAKSDNQPETVWRKP